MYLLEQLLGDESRLVNFQVRLLSDEKLRRRQKKDTLRFQRRLWRVGSPCCRGDVREEGPQEGFKNVGGLLV